MLPDRLSPEDARILRLESGPIAGHTCKVLVLGSPAGGRRLTIDALRAGVSGRLSRAPRLRQRLSSTPLRLAPPVWIDDESFDIARHVRSVPVASELDDAGLRALVGGLMSERLDRSRPLWTLDLAPLTDGRSALIWRLHHCMADGATAMRLGSAVLWDASSEAAVPDDGSWTPLPGPRALSRAALGARDRAALTASALGRGVRSLGSPSSWRSAAAELGQLPGTLRREVLPRALPSPLGVAAGTSRSVAWVSAPLTELHDAGKAVGEEVTINDVVLAVTAGGFHDWLAARGESGGRVRVKVPVSLHAQAADAANRDSFLFVDLPVSEPRVAGRMRAIARATAERKRHHDAERLDRLLGGIAHLPGGRHVMRLTMSPRVFTFNVSNVRGPQEPLFVLGAPVESLGSLAEIAIGHALRVSVVSAFGELSFGLCADSEAVPDLERFVTGMERSVEELLAAAG